MGAFDFDPAADEQLVNAGRCAGREARRITKGELADVQGMKSIHILARINGGKNNLFRNLGR